MTAAYQSYSAGQYDQAVTSYRLAAESSAGPAFDDWADAEIGVQNCQVQTGKFTEAGELGRYLLGFYPHNLTILANTAYAYFRLGSYRQAILYYRQMLASDNRNQTALEGLSWCYHYLGDNHRAQAYLEQAQRQKKNDPTLTSLYQQVIRNPVDLEATNYVTLVNYSSPVKRDGFADNLSLALTFNHARRLEFLYEKVIIDFVNPLVENTRENNFLASYSVYGLPGFTVTVKNITTTDEILGNGLVLFGNVDWNGFLISGSYSDYDQSRAWQGGFGYRHATERLILLSQIDLIHRDQLNALAKANTFPAFTQKLTYSSLPVTVGLDYTVGRSSLMVKNYGFLCLNTPDEISYQLGANIEYAGKHWSTGYYFSYNKGEHYTVRQPMQSVSSTIKLNYRW